MSDEKIVGEFHTAEIEFDGWWVLRRVTDGAEVGSSSPRRKTAEEYVAHHDAQARHFIQAERERMAELEAAARAVIASGGCTECDCCDGCDPIGRVFIDNLNAAIPNPTNGENA